MQKGQGLILVIVGILVIALVAGGAFYLGRSTTTKPSSNPIASSPTPQPTPTPQSTATPDETANWKTYTDPKKLYSFQYPATYEVLDEVPQYYRAILFDPNLPGWKLEDWLNSKMFSNKCSGPILRNTKVNTTLLAFEIVEKNSEGLFCWSSGDFTTRYKRTIKILTSSYQIDVIKWRLSDYEFSATKDKPGQNYSPEWKGDLFQQMSIPTQNPKYNAFASLVYKNGTDNTAEQVYDQILATFKFTQ